VIAHNDDMAMGALQVLNESGKKNVLVAGVDGLSEAINAIQNGDQYVATALNDPRYLGEVAIEAARGLATGKTIPAFVDAGTRRHPGQCGRGQARRHLRRIPSRRTLKRCPLNCLLNRGIHCESCRHVQTG
jgi:hypothetical protein